MRAFGRRCLSIANLMKPDGLLLKPEYLSDPRAHQPVISASECKVNISVLWVNLECSIELTDPSLSIQVNLLALVDIQDRGEYALRLLQLWTQCCTPSVT